MIEKTPVLWQRWLLAACGLSAIFGLSLIVAPGLFHSTLGSLTYNSFFEGDAFASLSAAEVAHQDFMFSLLGTLMVAWMVNIGALVAIPFRRGERWAWNAIGAGVLTWFLLDGGVSLAYGLVWNAFFNLGFLIAFGIPLLASYRTFHPAR